MPLPKPKPGEKQAEFMERCMHEAMAGTDDKDQAVAMCMNTWREEKETKMTTIEVENRAFPVEFRVEKDGDKPKIRGYAAVFNKVSELLGGFREKIAPGAFRKTLKEQDVRALFNHDPNIVLGRVGNGTLKLKEDEKGLSMEIDPPDTAQARDIVTLIERGDVNQGSFAFRVVKDSWDYDAKPPLRTLDEVTLFDASVVTYPAYADTSVDVRSFMHVIDPEDSEAIRNALDGLRTGPEPAEDHSEPSEPAQDHSEAEPVEDHSEAAQPRDLTTLVKEWAHAQELGKEYEK